MPHWKQVRQQSLVWHRMQILYSFWQTSRWMRGCHGLKREVQAFLPIQLEVSAFTSETQSSNALPTWLVSIGWLVVGQATRKGTHHLDKPWHKLVFFPAWLPPPLCFKPLLDHESSLKSTSRRLRQIEERHILGHVVEVVGCDWYRVSKVVEEIELQEDHCKI